MKDARTEPRLSSILLYPFCLDVPLFTGKLADLKLPKNDKNDMYHGIEYKKYIFSLFSFLLTVRKIL
jgi:hypothetical protein